MKVLMVNKFLFPNGGSETYVLKLGEYLKEIGHEVQYFGMEHEKRCVGNKVGAYTSNMNFHTESVLSKITYPLKTIYSREARKKIRLVLDDFMPDVVHLNNFNYQLTPSVIVEVRKWEKDRKHPVKIVYTAHDYQLICPNHMMNIPDTGRNCEKCLGGNYRYCLIHRCIHNSKAKSTVGMLEAMYWNNIAYIYRQIDKVICCSEFIKTKMDTNPVFRNKTIVMHNFVERPKTMRKQIPKEDYVLYLGRFSKEKGINTLLEVCKQLPDIPFVFAGSGPLDEKVSQVKNIRNIGFVNGEMLESVIRKARFSVYPSEWYENCPFSVMEAQMYKTPVIGARIGGIPELIQEGKTGELFESGNEEELKEKIQSLWNDRERLEEYEKNCENTNFDTIESYCKKLMKVYEE